MAEQAAHNRLVEGSNPSVPINCTFLQTKSCQLSLEDFDSIAKNIREKLNMHEKQLRLTNVLLALILIVLTLILVVNLIPYYVAGSIFGSFSSSSPSITISTSIPIGNEGFFISAPTMTPWSIRLP